MVGLDLPQAAEIIRCVYGNWPNSDRFGTTRHVALPQRVPAFIYLSTDGPLPKTVPSNNLDTRDKIIGVWQGQSTFVDGLTQETCRDFVHTGYGIAAIADVAETSRIQG